jgi:hypothetical protein
MGGYWSEIGQISGLPSAHGEFGKKLAKSPNFIVNVTKNSTCGSQITCIEVENIVTGPKIGHMNRPGDIVYTQV